MARSGEGEGSHSQRGRGRGGGRNGGSASSSPTARSSRAATGRRDPFLVVCRCFSFLTSVASILCIFVNILSAIRSFKGGYDIFDGIFRCYAVAMAVFVVVAETEWSFILRFWKVLEYWAGRGMLQIFVAVMTRAFPEDSRDRRDLILLQNIASYMLLSCGAIYIISGMLCIGFLKRSRQQKEFNREQAVRDLEELQRRREELEQLLVDERV